MARYLRKSTSATFKMGPFVASADGYTAATALSFAVSLSKNGGALGARSDATAITHDADGYYLVTVNATDTNTVGRLRVETPGTASNLPVWEDFVVLDGAVYDVLFGSVAPSTLGGTAQTGDNFARIGAAGAGLTALGDARLANLDAAVSTRLATSGYTTPPTAAANAAALLDLAAAIEGLTPRELGRLVAAVLLGKSTGGGTHYRDLADTKDRVAAVLDGSNNRTAVTRDAT